MILRKSSGLLRSVYLYEVEEGKRSKYEIVDMIEAQRELLLKEFSGMEDVGDPRPSQPSRFRNRHYRSAFLFCS